MRAAGDSAPDAGCARSRGARGATDADEPSLHRRDEGLRGERCHGSGSAARPRAAADGTPLAVRLTSRWTIWIGSSPIPTIRQRPKAGSNRRSSADAAGRKRHRQPARERRRSDVEGDEIPPVLHRREGQALTLTGVKNIHEDGGFDIWPDTTTLYTKILPGTVDRRRCVHRASGGWDHPHPLERFSPAADNVPGGGADARQRVNAINRFGALFFGKMWDVFLRQFVEYSPV